MTATLKIAKAELRKAIRNSLKPLSGDEIAIQSTKIHETLISLPEYQRATNLSIYLSMPGGEASTEPAVLHALDLGKKVFVPYLHESSASGESRTLMDMVKLHSKEDYVTLPPDKWGIPTPSKDSIPRRGQCLGIFNDKAQEQDKIETSDLHIVVMPGVAFDSKCQRLGHGKGFYDIFLSQYRKRLASQGKMPFLVGLALEQQVLPSHQEVPTSTTDWRLDALIVGDGTIRRPHPHLSM